LVSVNLAALLAWYDREKRALPWRLEPTPYRVWISEIMLQQTQVDKVLSYYARFLARFPNVRALARAGEADVLEAFAGLGYYSRARNLHRAARLIVSNHGGELPEAAEAWARLPGIGPYTLGAVRSIAYGEALPLVDGNVERVLSRVLGLRRRRGQDMPKLWRIAEQLFTDDALARKRPGDVNQALMELGAMLCTPTTPSCARCPWRDCCLAAMRGEPERFPLPKPAVRKRRLKLFVGWLERRGRVFVSRRPSGGLWAGMMALPTVEARSLRAARSLLARSFAAQGFGLVRTGVILARTERTLTHRQVEMVLLALTARDAAPGQRWVPTADLAGLGMPTAFSALLEKRQDRRRR
jgi:A/G-specific adenine glycosylase